MAKWEVTTTEGKSMMKVAGFNFQIGEVMKIKKIRPEVIEAIRRHHADSIRPTREIVGRLVVRKGEAVVYERLKNTAKGDNRFMVHMLNPDQGLDANEFGIILHSHPFAPAVPSWQDLKGAGRDWLGRPYAIYSTSDDNVRLWRLHKDRKGYTEIEIDG